MEFGAVQKTQQESQTQSYYNSPAPEEQTEGGAAIDFWGILRRRFFLISFFILIAIGGGVLYMLNATKIYTAEAKVQIYRKNSSSGMNIENLSVFNNAANNADAVRHVNSFVSTANLQKVLIDQNLVELNTFSDISDKFDKDVFEYIKKNLNIQQDKENQNLYSLSFDTQYEEDAPKFLNNLVQAYREELIDNFRKGVTDSVKMHEKLIEKYNTVLEDAKKEIGSFRKNHNLKVVTPAGASVAQYRVEELSKRLSVAEEELRGLKHTSKQVESWQLAARTPLSILKLVIEIPDDKDNDYRDSRRDDHAERYKAQVSAIQNQLALESEKLGPKNFRIIRLKESLKAQQQLLSEVMAEEEQKMSKMDPADRLELEVDKLTRDIESQQNFVDSMKVEMKAAREEAESIVASLKEEQDLRENKKLAEENLKIAMDNLTKIKLERDTEAYKFEIMQVATDGELSHPLPLKVFGMSIVLGCLAGFGLAYLVDLADKTFRSPHEIIKSLNLALIGHVPVIQMPSKKKLANQEVHPVICTFHKPKSQSAEAFRAVRTSLYFSVQGQKHQVIQVTSPTPGDGKSTLAANLATVIAQSGKSVLLVDADFRRPSVQKIFEINETPGFSDVLVQQTTIEEAVQQTPVEGLEILACGNKPLQPSELLTSHRLPEVIDELREMYDFVVIDTPPVLLVTDPCPVAANVDGVICAMRIKKNVRVNAERMVEILRSVNANILGVVVNGVGAQGNYASQYNYGAYQAGYSQYGYGAYGYGRYGQSEKVYDDGRKANLSVPRQQLIESNADDEFVG